MDPLIYESHKTDGQVSAHLVLFELCRSRFNMTMVLSSWCFLSHKIGSRLLVRLDLERQAFCHCFPIPSS